MRNATKTGMFYMKFILPELALPRYGTYTGIRQPEKPWYTFESLREARTVSFADCTVLVDSPGTSKLDRKKVCQSKHTASSTEKGEPSHKVEQNINLPPPLEKRSCRSKTVKFVGRQILHKWIVDEKQKKEKWYSGTVLDVLSGKDGDPSAVYEVLYQGEETAHEVDGLDADVEEGSLKFVDI